MNQIYFEWCTYSFSWCFLLNIFNTQRFEVSAPSEMLDHHIWSMAHRFQLFIIRLKILSVDFIVTNHQIDNRIWNVTFPVQWTLHVSSMSHLCLWLSFYALCLSKSDSIWSERKSYEWKKKTYKKFIVINFESFGCIVGLKIFCIILYIFSQWENRIFQFHRIYAIN